jgi:hypothetical protein
MSKGERFPSEARWVTDAVTGVRQCQLTSNEAISHPSYFLQSSFVPGDRRLFFTSYRSGAPQLYLADYPGGEFIQLTDGPAVHPFSAAYHAASGAICFTRGGALWAIDPDTLTERLIFDAGAGQLGEPSISPDGRFLTAAARQGDRRGLVAGGFDGRGWHWIDFPRIVIHPQFHPLEPEWIEFAADPAPRMHRVRRDGSGLECLYQHSNEEFVVHETFLGRTGDLVFTIWPRLVCRMDWTTRQISEIAAYNAWHIAPNRAGTLILCDTNHPDAGVQLVDSINGSRRTVCHSQSSNRGTQWARSCYAMAEDFAAASSALSWMEADGDTVYGPQHTHPHPAWSATERRITFASDRTGSAQVYVSDLTGV